MIQKCLPKLLLLAMLFALPAFAVSSAVAAGTTALDDSEVQPEAFGPDSNAFSDDSLQTDPLIDSLSPDDTEQPSQPEAALPTKPNDLWQRIKSGYAMPEMKSPFVSVHESWYAARPEYVNRMVGRSQKYLYYIVGEVEKRGMPSEIALLPMVESAFNPQAYSRSRASGIWQFIPSTGKSFGLKQNWWVDNRRDIRAATGAALTYLERLHVMFGTWELALAAYNAGEGTVQRAIDRNRKNGLPTDYQSLKLPPETREYVPKLLAVKNIVNNPEQYGLNIEPIANQPYFIKVSTSKSIDTHLAAKLAGISPDEFSSLNPAYNRPVMPPVNGEKELLLPIGNEQIFLSNLANYDKPLASWQTYNPKRGEKLDSISRKFGVSVAQLRSVNKLSSRARLKPDQPLLVPLQNESTEYLAVAEIENTPTPASAPENIATRRASYKVRKGDTVGSIAKSYGVGTRQLMAANHLKNSHLREGQVLTLAIGNNKLAENHKRASSAKVTSVRRKTHYVVRRGESLASIARKFKVVAADLQRWNKLNSDLILPGHKLTIYRPEAA